MSRAVEQIVEEALGLPSEARARLADRLVESLDPAEDGHVRGLSAKASDHGLTSAATGQA